MEVSKDQMSMLLENNLFESAQMLGCFLVSSSASNPEPNPYSKAENLVLQGDALYGGKEYRRALNAYKQALQHCKNIPRQGGNSTRALLSAASRSPSPSSFSISTINENEVKFKVALCHSALNEHRSAIFEMEGIPSKVRTLRMNLTMGKLYRISRNNRAASTCYKECLRSILNNLISTLILNMLLHLKNQVLVFKFRKEKKIGQWTFIPSCSLNLHHHEDFSPKENKMLVVLEKTESLEEFKCQFSGNGCLGLTWRHF